MSRAQYNQPYSPQYGSGMPGTVVNGGLIDFQDNLCRGVQEYVTPSMLLQQHNQGGQPAFSIGGNQFAAASSMQGQVLCGPASFIHVNGVTYKPVEDPNSKVAGVDSGKVLSDPGSTVSSAGGGASAEQVPRMLSRKELDERVRSQVEAYMRNQHESTAGSYQSRSVRGGASTASAEDLAAQRVFDLNAGMPVARGRGGKGKALLQSRW